MNVPRALVITAMAGGLLTVGGSPAFAAYTPSAAAGAVSDSTPALGQPVTFAGSGFSPGTRVAVYVDGKFYAATVADSAGRFSIRVTPSGCGHHSIVARGTGANSGARTVSSSVTVTCGVSRVSVGAPVTPSSTASGLPFTGTEATSILTLAAVLTGAGVGFRVVGRRRRTIRI